MKLRLPKKRTALILTALLILLVGVTVIVWEVNDWPPVRLILKYGFPPSGGPTGNVKTFEGVEFVELSPCYFRMGSHYGCERGDLLGRIGAAGVVGTSKHRVYRGGTWEFTKTEVDRTVAPTTGGEIIGARCRVSGRRHTGQRSSPPATGFRPVFTLPEDEVTRVTRRRVLLAVLALFGMGFDRHGFSAPASGTGPCPRRRSRAGRSL